jgi:hypothetical protein
MSNEQTKEDWKFEDDLGTIDALLGEVNRVLLRAALKGGVNKDTRTQTRYKLQRALETFDKLRAPPEER